MKLHAQLHLDSTEQAFVFGFRRTVQAIGGFFQTFAVFDGQAAVGRLQQRLIFEGLQSFRYSDATDSQHQREKLMREQHLVAVEPITGHKQPAGQSFSDIAARVGQGSIVRLYPEGVGIAKQASQQSDAPAASVR